MAKFQKLKHSAKQIDDLLDKVNNGEVSGGGIQIVDDISKLPQDAAVGSVAVVEVPGSIQETSFRDLYQPPLDMIDQASGTLINPERLSSIKSLKITAPSSFELERPLGVYIVPRTFSATNQNMITLMLVDGYVIAMRMGGNEISEFVFVDYSSGSPVINNDSIKQFNDILATDDWCYFGNSELTTSITEEEFNTWDMYVKAVSGVPSTADVYIKKDEWEQLYEKDFEKLARDLDKINTTAESKADKITIATYDSWEGIHPNVYTTHSISSTGSITIYLAAITDTTVYNEYILELKFTSTPSSVAFKNADGTAATIVWANGIAPTFEAGFTYLISIANNFGVFAKYINS